MKSSNFHAAMSLFVTEQNEGSWEKEQYCNFSPNDFNKFVMPIFSIDSPTFVGLLENFLKFSVGPYFQQQTGPLQPKDEKTFSDMISECQNLILQINEHVESSINKVQERKEKENLTERPN